MATLSIIGIIVGLVFLIATAWKGWSIYICGIGAAIIVMLFSGLNVLETLMGPFMSGFTTFVSNYLILFLITTIFAKIMGDAGVAKVIAVKSASLIKRARPELQPTLAVLVVVVVQLLLTYGGINAFVIIFLMAALCKDIFKELNLPWRLYMLAGFSTATITVSMLPGTPAIQNLIPTNYLGTTAMAAPMMGLICSVVCFVLEMAYATFVMRRVVARGEGFLPSGQVIDSRENVKMDYETANYNVLYCLVPCIVLLVLMNIIGWSPTAAMTAACVLAVIMFHKTLPWKQLPATIKAGCENAVSTCMNVSVVVGFGSVVAATVGYSTIMGALDMISGSPLLQLVIAISVACGVSGSSSGGLTIGLNQFADKFLAMGLDPQIIHRVSCIASTGLDTLPHNAGVLVAYEVAGLKYSQAYIHTFVECCIIPIFITALAVVLAMVGIV